MAKSMTAVCVDGRNFGAKALTTFSALFVGLCTLAIAGPAWAAAGHADPGQIGLQDPVTPIAHEIDGFYNDLLVPIIVGVSLFVLVLLIYVIFRFNEKANPVPSQLTHHTGLELAWTIIPVLILVVIAIPSFKLLNNQLTFPQADITMKVTGHQWYWTYEYPKDQGGGFNFDSYLLQGNDLKPGMLRQLAVDNEAVVPVGKTIIVQVTSTDVIHSFTVPSFGIRIDAVPGRINDTWFKATSEGMFYGQCSELCGKDHSFMPVAVRVVNDSDFTAWLDAAKKKYAGAQSAPTNAFAAAAAPLQ